MDKAEVEKLLEANRVKQEDLLKALEASRLAEKLLTQLHSLALGKSSPEGKERVNRPHKIPTDIRSLPWADTRVKLGGKPRHRTKPQGWKITATDCVGPTCTELHGKVVRFKSYRSDAMFCSLECRRAYYSKIKTKERKAARRIAKQLQAQVPEIKKKLVTLKAPKPAKTEPLPPVVPPPQEARKGGHPPIPTKKAVVIVKGDSLSPLGEVARKLVVEKLV